MKWGKSAHEMQECVLRERSARAALPARKQASRQNVSRAAT